MTNEQRYKKLFLKSRQVGKKIPLSNEERLEMKVLLGEMEAIWLKLGYREREKIANWCASEVVREREETED